MAAGKSPKELGRKERTAYPFKSRYRLQIDAVEIKKDNPLAEVVYQ